MKGIVTLLAATALVTGCGLSGSTTPPPSGTPSPFPSLFTSTAQAQPSIPGVESPSPSQPPIENFPLTQVSNPGHVTGTLTGPCHIAGVGLQVLPDPKCTPGSIDPRITAAILCAPGYTTSNYRPPASDTTKFKYEEAYPAYGIPLSDKGELDHLVSLELGGSNDATNLWPEVGSIPNPKDSVENKLHKWVCEASGQEAERRLRAAQRAIATDWTTALVSLGAT